MCPGVEALSRSLGCVWDEVCYQVSAWVFFIYCLYCIYFLNFIYSVSGTNII